MMADEKTVLSQNDVDPTHSGIADFFDSEDGMFTLDALRCVGACAIAPAVSINGKVMQLAIPRSLVEANDNVDIEFKICDNITHPDDVMDYYISGDSMPIGRLHSGF